MVKSKGFETNPTSYEGGKKKTHVMTMWGLFQNTREEGFSRQA